MALSDLDTIERVLILRIARALPLAMAGLAGLTLVAAVGLMLYSLTPATEPAVAPTPPPPPAVTVSTAEIRSLHTRGASSGGATSTVSGAAQGTAPGRAAVPSADAIAIATALHGLRIAADSARLPWTNSTERYCADAYLGYCLDYATRVTRRGVGPTVLQVVGLYDVPGASEERAAAQRSSESYLVDPSNAKEKTTALAEAVTMIKEFPAEQRMTALATWADLRTTREQERRAKIANAEATAAAERARATETRIEREEARREARRNAILGAGGALSSLFVIGLILAVLAIERNTRLLHAIHASDARRPGAA